MSIRDSSIEKIKPYSAIRRYVPAGKCTLGDEE
jgi:hypothetical protein